LGRREREVIGCGRQAVDLPLTVSRSETLVPAWCAERLHQPRRLQIGHRVS